MPIETKSLKFLVRALGSRNFRLFFFGQAVSLIGTWMQLIAMRWLIYRLTKSELMLGVVGFVSDAPLFLLVPFAGVLADRLKRDRIMVVTQALSAFQAALLAVLVLTEQVAVWHVLVLGGFLGIVSAFDITARQAFIVDIIGQVLSVLDAIALNSFIFNGALLIGPAVAPLLMPVFAEDILRGGPRVFGYLMSATGLGALAGAVLLASRRSLRDWRK